MATTCSLCCDESQAWAVGPCDHVTCLVCSVRLRVLCDQRDCPVCREKLNKVVITASVKNFALPPHGSKVDRKYGFFFESIQLHDKYKSLKQYRCTKCREKPVFGSLNLLRDHSRKTHGLFYCDICCNNLKLFPYELRQYTRQELTRHRREGDPDDKSYRGHPLCQFCDERFFDNDALHAHLRKVHFWCHFCESDGKQDYYCSYSLLRAHFRQEHYLCEEGQCRQEKFTSVFRNKLDLQVHKATAHTKGVTKAVAKQMKQLDVGFTYGRGEDPRIGGVVTPAGGRQGQWQYVQHSKPREQEEVTVMQTDPQHQYDTKPPLNGQRNRPTSTTRFNSKPHVYEQPPRLKHRQRNEAAEPAAEPVREEKPEVVKRESNKLDSSRSNTNTVGLTASSSATTVSKIKEPPGLGPPGLGPNTTTVNTCDWPDLMALNIEAKGIPKQPQNVTVSKMLPQYVQQPVGRYNPLEPSQFPPLGNSAQSFNSNLALPGQPSVTQTDISTNTSSSSSIPPGFVWQQIKQDHIYMSAAPAYTSAVGSTDLSQQSTRNKEESVINQVREALEYDREKFNHFRNLSGWYRNSEITVQEYVMHCRQLFGESTWMKVGPQLAQVMPIEGKRNELIRNIMPNSLSTMSDFFPSAFSQPSSAATTLHVSHSAPVLHNPHSKWPRESSSVPNWQSECEYPALHSDSTTTMIRQSGLPQSSWKARVRV